MSDEKDELLPINSPSKENELLSQNPTRGIIFAVIPMFMGYAALVSFQSDIKSRIGIMDETSTPSYLFGEAISMLFLAALLFRLLHNVLLSWMTPRRRVFLACGFMGLATATVAILFYAFKAQYLWAVFLVYICGGAAIGTFEANLVSCVTPLGHQTKKWGLLGMPLGYNGVAIGGFALFSIAPGDPVLQGVVFGVVAALCIVAAVVFQVCVPAIVVADASSETGFHAMTSFKDLRPCLQEWREWVAPIRWNLVALFLDMFACILASTVALYVFKVGDVPIVPASHITLPYNAFQALFNVCSFLGDFTSRQLAYDPPRWWPMSHGGNPIRFTIFTVAGLVMCLSKVAMLAPLGIFVIMFGNGLIYASSTKYIDGHVQWRFNLVAISFWLFTGDCGSYIASTLTTPISNVMGRVVAPH